MKRTYILVTYEYQTMFGRDKKRIYVKPNTDIPPIPDVQITKTLIETYHTHKITQKPPKTLDRLLEMQSY